MKRIRRFPKRSARARKRSRRTAAAGFSLIEVMVASAVLLVGLAGTLSGIQAGLRELSHQRDMTQAIAVAEAQVEELLLQLPGSPDLTPGVHDGPAYARNGQRTSAGGFFQTRWTVVADVPVSGMKQLTVEVSWPDMLWPVRLTTVRR